MAIIINGFTPRLVEPNIHIYNIYKTKIEEKIAPKTKAILVVYLYGKACKMDIIMKIVQKYNLEVIEDCAQAHGAIHKGKKISSFVVGCFSFYPTKNLGSLTLGWMRYKLDFKYKTGYFG